MPGTRLDGKRVLMTPAGQGTGRPTSLAKAAEQAKTFVTTVFKAMPSIYLVSDKIAVTTGPIHLIEGGWSEKSRKIT